MRRESPRNYLSPEVCLRIWHETLQQRKLVDYVFNTEVRHLFVPSWGNKFIVQTEFVLTFQYSFHFSGKIHSFLRIVN